MVVMMANLDRCAWFHKKHAKDQSRLDLLYSCILSAKKIQFAMTMLSELKIGSQDMRGPKRRKKPTAIDDKKTSSSKKTNNPKKPNTKK